MSYNDLTIVKKINGIPADIRYFDKLGENDLFFKNISDIDEDLEALDRSIIPAITNACDLGTALKAFRNLYSYNILSNYLNIIAGTLVAPSLLIGNAGFASLNNNELSFIGTPGLESIRFMTSGLQVKAANNTQLKIQNTLAGSESLCSIGSDQFGLNFSINGAQKSILSESALEIFAPQLVLPINSPTVPSLTYSGYLGTGLSTLTGEELNLILKNNLLYSFKETGVSSKLEEAASFEYLISNDLESNKFSFGKSRGTLISPLAIESQDVIYEGSFKGHNGTDLTSGAEIVVQSEEAYGSTFGTAIYLRTCAVGSSFLEDRLAIGKNERSDIAISGSLGLEKLLLATVGLEQEIDVRHISKILVDTSMGDIGIKGFIGGQEGQMLYIYRKVPTNTLTITFDDLTVTQKILLKDNSDYISSGNYGGIILSFDDGIWREISRS